MRDRRPTCRPLLRLPIHSDLDEVGVRLAQLRREDTARRAQLAAFLATAPRPTGPAEPVDGAVLMLRAASARRESERCRAVTRELVLTGRQIVVHSLAGQRQRRTPPVPVG